MKILMAQINSTVGDFEGNLERMRRVVDSSSRDVDLVVFPECAICGYPPQDLLDYPDFARKSEEAAAKMLKNHSQLPILFGFVERNLESGKPYRNTAIMAYDGKILGKYFKRLLPTYDVFDEDRFFEPGRQPLIVDFKNEKIAITICEDIWSEAVGTPLQNRYRQNPVSEIKGASLLVNISASPFEYSKVIPKRELLQQIARTMGMPVCYVNTVGANDGIIFDGRSYLWSPDALIAEVKAYEEDSLVADTRSNSKLKPTFIEEIPNIYDALVLGIREYCRKQNFDSVVLGLSGGIDSSLVACLAIDAIGKDNVVGVLLPSRYTSAESNADAIEIAKRTQMPIHVLAIEEIFQSSLRTLSKAFEGTEAGVAEENLQSRIRGLLLMALSNKFGHLLLTTGNKSELAVGYCTLYGDMNGGLAPLSDVYKTQVYALSREANRRAQRIPERCFTKAPTAELRHNQTDQDTLPPYERLDSILKMMIEDFLSAEEISRKGFDLAEAQQIQRWLSRSEYKRYQMTLGLKVSSKAFGIGRRIPLVQKFF